MRRVALAGVLAVTWMLWSGHTDPLMLAFAAASIGGVVWLSARMGIDDDEGVPTPILGLRTLPYLAWLCWQVVLSNIMVATRIWQGRHAIAPRLVRVTPTQQTPAARVLYANSITLTPGTVSVRMYEDEILVHALLAETAEDVLSGDMDRRVTELERV